MPNKKKNKKKNDQPAIPGMAPAPQQQTLAPAPQAAAPAPDVQIRDQPQQRAPVLSQEEADLAYAIALSKAEAELEYAAAQQPRPVEGAGTLQARAHQPRPQQQTGPAETVTRVMKGAAQHPQPVAGSSQGQLQTGPAETVTRVMKGAAQHPQPDTGSPQARAPQPSPQQQTGPAETVTRDMKSLNLGSNLLPPQKRLYPQFGQFPGKSGKNCRLRVNHFRMKIPTGVVYQYSVKVVPPWTRPYKKSDKDIYQLVINEWRKVNTVAKKAPMSWVFDGNTTLYCTKAYEGIPHTEISLQMEGDTEPRSFFVTDIKIDTQIMISEDLARWAVKGQSGSMPQDALSAVNAILSQSRVLNLNYTNIGHTFFRNDGRVIDLGFGKEVWSGIFSSVRPNSWTERGTQYLATLNANISHKAATKQLPLVIDDTMYCYTDQVLDRNAGSWRKGMSPQQVDVLRRDLKGLKLRYTLPNGQKREYRVNDILQPADQLMIPDLKKTVKTYFFETHKVKLKYPHLPCLWLGSRNKTIYIPMEFCEVSSQALPRTKQLPDMAQASMIRNTAMRVGEREKMILDELQRNNRIYKDDPFAKSFNLSIADNLVQLTGRILPAPSIEYQDQKTVNIRNDDPGKWNPRGVRYVSGGDINNWAILDLVGLRGDEISSVIQSFGKTGREVGLQIQCVERKSVFSYNCREHEAGGTFENIVQEFKKHGTKLDLVLVILPFKGSKVYNEIKNLGDLKYKIPTQCCLKKVLFGKDGRPSGQVISNLCLKINSKLAGTNHMLQRNSRPKVFSEPVMILGADVTHAAAQFKGIKPSIAAVVGSVDPTAQMKYEVEIRVQETEQNEEMIQDMENIIMSLLRKFRVRTKQKPRRLIMFRDGVSEGQFQSVMARELLAIRAACSKLGDGSYKPLISYIVVQKRHHTRFFPADDNKYFKNGNALAGTVVDQGINHPTEGDFYLLSHEGIQGTSRPCHYHVLWDDSNMGADETEQLAYYLCHLYSRCTKSVSYPAPTYYSHLAADRARKHHDHLTDKERKNPKEAKRILEEEGSKTNIMYFV